MLYIMIQRMVHYVVYNDTTDGALFVQQFYIVCF